MVMSAETARDEIVKAAANAGLENTTYTHNVAWAFDVENIGEDRFFGSALFGSWTIQDIENDVVYLRDNLQQYRMKYLGQVSENSYGIFFCSAGPNQSVITNVELHYPPNELDVVLNVERVLDKEDGTWCFSTYVDVTRRDVMTW